MKRCFLLAIILVLSFTSATLAQRADNKSVREHKKYIKYHSRYAYPDVTTVCAPQITAFDSMAGTGITFSHLHFLDKEGHFAAQISLSLLYNSSRIIFGEKFGRDSTIVGDRVSFFVAPGITWHPRGNNHRADFFVGMQAPLGFVNRSTYYEYYQGFSERRDRDAAFLSAILFEAGLHLQVKRHFVFGINISGGPLISGGKGALVLFGASFGRRY